MKYVDGEYYHLYNRGARKQRIVFNAGNFSYFIRTAHAKSRIHETTIVAYCLMPNHFHLVVRQERGGSIGKFIQTTLNSYVQALNNQQRLSGTLFQGKTKARHVDTDSYLLHLVRYLHLNPVAAKLVKRPEDWEFSDYGEWILISTTVSHPKAAQDLLKPSDGFRECILSEIRQNLLGPYFANGAGYAKFVEEYEPERDIKSIAKYLIDD